MLSQIPEEQMKMENGAIGESSAKSMGSIYSSSSSKFSSRGLTKRKLTLNRQQPDVVAVSEIRQRVLSAHMIKLKTVQNQLNMAQQQIFELQQENKSLRITVRRQEKALTKYDGANAELPYLLNSHSEEIRIWQAKNRDLHKQIKDITATLKQRDNTLLLISDQNKHFHQLNKDKHLEEREKLNERVKELETMLSEQRNDLKLLSRKHQLDTKVLKTQIHQELQKNKELCLKIEKANLEIARLHILEMQDRCHPSRFITRNLRESTRSAISVDQLVHYSNLYPSTSENNSKIRSCSNSLYSSKTPDTHRNGGILFENQYVENEPEPDFYEKESNIEEETKKIQKYAIRNSPEMNLGKEEPHNKDDVPLENKIYKDDEEELISKFNQINKDIEHKEILLDKSVDNLIKENTISKPPIAEVKRQNIDLKKKTKLLAALQAIDANESFEN